ncbi:MAG: hypothetical protein KDB22_22735 [Planctomycetales bacterium]|nr:hypothetical protein [Planctomycetales bacterium]
MARLTRASRLEATCIGLPESGDSIELGNCLVQEQRTPLAKTLFAGIVLIACGLVTCHLKPPFWFQPTAVGVFWASQFLAGFACSGIGRGRVTWAVWATLVFLLSSQALCLVSDIGRAESQLLASLAFVVGWLASKQTWPRQPALQAGLEGNSEYWLRFSILDLAMLTTLSAVCCAAGFRLYSHSEPASHLLLMISAFCCLIMGLIGSWTASAWVFKDCWTLPKLTGVIVFPLVVCGLIIARSPMSIASTVQWLMSGPINVIASQITFVLAACALLRLEHCTQSPLVDADPGAALISA